jgi:hypothetical protein
MSPLPGYLRLLIFFKVLLKTWRPLAREVDSLVGEVFALQRQGPEFGPPELPLKKRKSIGDAYYPGPGLVETAGSLGLSGQQA